MKTVMLSSIKPKKVNKTLSLPKQPIPLNEVPQLLLKMKDYASLRGSFSFHLTVFDSKGEEELSSHYCMSEDFTTNLLLLLRRTLYAEEYREFPPVVKEEFLSVVEADLAIPIIEKIVEPLLKKKKRRSFFRFVKQKNKKAWKDFSDEVKETSEATTSPSSNPANAVTSKTADQQLLHATTAAVSYQDTDFPDSWESVSIESLEDVKFTDSSGKAIDPAPRLVESPAEKVETSTPITFPVSNERPETQEIISPSVLVSMLNLDIKQGQAAENYSRNLSLLNDKISQLYQAENASISEKQLELEALAINSQAAAIRAKVLIEEIYEMELALEKKWA